MQNRIREGASPPERFEFLPVILTAALLVRSEGLMRSRRKTALREADRANTRSVTSVNRIIAATAIVRAAKKTNAAITRLKLP